jgi:hypothetical protein
MEAHGLIQKGPVALFALNCPVNMNEHKPVVKRIYSGTNRFSVMVTATPSVRRSLEEASRVTC